MVTLYRCSLPQSGSKPVASAAAVAAVAKTHSWLVACPARSRYRRTHRAPACNQCKRPSQSSRRATGAERMQGPAHTSRTQHMPRLCNMTSTRVAPEHAPWLFNFKASNDSYHVCNISCSCLHVRPTSNSEWTCMLHSTSCRPLAARPTAHGPDIGTLSGAVGPIPGGTGPKNATNHIFRYRRPTACKHARSRLRHGAKGRRKPELPVQSAPS